MRTSPGNSVRPGELGPPLATAVALLSLRREAMPPQPSRAAVLDGCDLEDLVVVLEVLASALLSTAFPDDGEAMLQRLGLLAADWQLGGDS